MNAKRRHRAWGHPVKRAAANVFATFLLEVAAEKQRKHFVRIDTLAIRLREITRPGKADHAVDRAGLVSVPLALEFIHTGGHSKKECEMAAGGATHRAPALWINLVFGRLGAKPPHGG